MRSESIAGKYDCSFKALKASKREYDYNWEKIVTCIHFDRLAFACAISGLRRVYYLIQRFVFSAARRRTRIASGVRNICTHNIML
jgi:hypothetical protein